MRQGELWPEKWEPLELAYFAGLFDGEGSVGIYDTKLIAQKGGQAQFRVCICNNDPRPLDRVKTLFGGRVRPRLRTYRGRLTNNWEWCIHGHNADRFLVAVLPYLIIKRDQAEVYLSARRHLVGQGRIKTPTYAEALVTAELFLKKLKIE